jgi:hypothetical protein
MSNIEQEMVKSEIVFVGLRRWYFDAKQRRVSRERQHTETGQTETKKARNARSNGPVHFINSCARLLVLMEQIREERQNQQSSRGGEEENSTGGILIGSTMLTSGLSDAIFHDNSSADDLLRQSRVIHVQTKRRRAHRGYPRVPLLHDSAEQSESDRWNDVGGPQNGERVMEAITFDLARPYPVNADQCAQYRRDGHILLRGVAEPEEIEYYSPLVTDLVGQHAKTLVVRVATDETPSLLEYVANVWQKSEEIKEFVYARRFARIAATLMGVRGVRLYHDEALVKEAGGCATPWHKDHYSWPLATHHTIKMWLALADVQIEMAAIRYATHSHRAGQFPEVSPSYESEQLFGRIIRQHNMPVVSCAMKAGDASFHSGEILHSTTANTTSECRKSLAVIYFADGTRVMTPNHEHRQVDLAEFLPGLTPGDLAASHLNPLLYSSDEAE